MDQGNECQGIKVAEVMDSWSYCVQRQKWERISVAQLNFFVFILESQYMEKHNLETSCIFPLLLTQSRNIWTTWPGSCLLGDYRLAQVDGINPHKWIV